MRASWGSRWRAVSAARWRVVRSSRLPALEMGWLLRSLLPVSDARGASPVKDRNLPAVGNRWAGPMVAVRAGPPIWARPGRERASLSGPGPAVAVLPLGGMALELSLVALSRRTS